MELGKWEKYLFSVSAGTIALFSGLGFYLIHGTPKIKSLVASGHNHMLSFAFGAMIFGLIVHLLGLSEKQQRYLSIWMTISFLGPLFLIVAGVTGYTKFLVYTDAVFQGSFVVLWVILISYILSSGKKKVM